MTDNLRLGEEETEKAGQIWVRTSPGQEILPTTKNGERKGSRFEDPLAVDRRNRRRYSLPLSLRVYHWYNCTPLMLLGCSSGHLRCEDEAEGHGETDGRPARSEPPATVCPRFHNRGRPTGARRCLPAGQTLGLVGILDRARNVFVLSPEWSAAPTFSLCNAVFLSLIKITFQCSSFLWWSISSFFFPDSYNFGLIKFWSFGVKLFNFVIFVAA